MGRARLGPSHSSAVTDMTVGVVLAQAHPEVLDVVQMFFEPAKKSEAM